MSATGKFAVVAASATQRKPVDPKLIAEFAQGANIPHAVPAAAPTPPTQSPDEAPAEPDAAYWATLDNKRRGGINVFNVRFTDRENAQLKFIAEKHDESKHEFCLKAIQDAIAKALA